MIYFIVFWFLIIIVALAIIAFLIYRKFFAQSDDSWKGEVRAKLQQIHSNKDLNSESKLMQLDKLFEHCLQKEFRNNFSLGVNLKNKSSKFQKTDLDKIWSAHKIRNRIAHDINFNAGNSYQDIEKAMNTLEIASKKWSL